LRSIQPIQSVSETKLPAEDDTPIQSSLDAVQYEDDAVNKTLLVADEMVGEMCTTTKLEIAGSNGVGATPKNLGSVSETYNMGF
jgi:hypothetical protein